jgi:hypothetical protein
LKSSSVPQPRSPAAHVNSNAGHEHAVHLRATSTVPSPTRKVPVPGGGATHVRHTPISNPVMGTSRRTLATADTATGGLVSNLERDVDQ